MQVQRIQINNTTFGNTKGGVKNLKIIINKDNLQFLESTKNSDVSVFVAGGSEIDKKVNDANINAMKKSANKSGEKKQNRVGKMFSNIIRA